MTQLPNSTADNIDGINTDYDADPRAKNLIKGKLVELK